MAKNFSMLKWRLANLVQNHMFRRGRPIDQARADLLIGRFIPGLDQRKETTPADELSMAVLLVQAIDQDLLGSATPKNVAVELVRSYDPSFTLIPGEDAKPQAAKPEPLSPERIAAIKKLAGESGVPWKVVEEILKNADKMSACKLSNSEFLDFAVKSRMLIEAEAGREVSYVDAFALVQRDSPGMCKVGNRGGLAAKADKKH